MATPTQTGPEVITHYEDSQISALSTEVLELIFEFIQDVSPLTLASLALVNKTFYASAHPFKHRHQMFTFRGDMKDQVSGKSHGILMSLMKDPTKRHILYSIRSITVMSTLKHSDWRVATLYDRSYREAHDKKWLLMADFLSKIPHLKSFTLQGTDQLPVVLLDALERCHPQASLHIENWTRIDDMEDHNNPAELALACSPNLRTLRAQLVETTSRIDLRQVALRRIVAVSPKLELVDVFWGFPARASRNTTSSQIKEESEVRKKFFEDLSVSSNSIRSLRSRGAIHVEFFEDVTDLRNLHSLDLGHIYEPLLSSSYQGHNQEFPQLKHLSLAFIPTDNPGFYSMMNDFLRSCSRLESLCLTNWTKNLPLSMICQHRSTLRSLALHEVEYPNFELPLSISHSDLQLMKQNFEKLEDLTIDAGEIMMGQDLDEILTSLAMFPLLRTIRICIPLGVADEANRTPYIFLDEDETRAEVEAHKAKPFSPINDPCWLENAWSLLRHEKKKNGSKPLRKLQFLVGEWERDRHGANPAGWLIWEAANRRYYTITPHERDDRPDDINVHIKGKKPWSDVDLHEIRRIPIEWLEYGSEHLG